MQSIIGFESSITVLNGGTTYLIENIKNGIYM